MAVKDVEEMAADYLTQQEYWPVVQLYNGLGRVMPGIAYDKSGDYLELAIHALEQFDPRTQPGALGQ